MNIDSRFLDVDRHGVLRVPALVWVSLALLARYWILLLIVGVSLARRNSDAVMLLGGEEFSAVRMLVEVPAIVVAWAAARRVPEAGRAMRFLWRHGRELMALTALANLAWTSSLLLASNDWALWPELFLASCCLLDLAIVLSMYTNPVFKQLFREFPARPAPEGGPPP